MAAEGVPFEWLDDAEVMRRWPQWRLDPTRTARSSRPTAGSPTRIRGNAAHQRLARAARRHAPRAAPRSPAIASTTASSRSVVDDGRPSRPAAVVIATDAWTNDLLWPLGVELPLDVTQEQVT